MLPSTNILMASSCSSRRKIASSDVSSGKEDLVVEVPASSGCHLGVFGVCKIEEVVDDDGVMEQCMHQMSNCCVCWYSGRLALMCL
jgi:hypothetical protein